MQFPKVEGDNLAGEHFWFPRDFSAERRTIVLVAFDLKQRADLETWVPFIERLGRDGHAQSRLLAVLSRSMEPMKNAIVATMRKGAAAPQAHAATVPLFVDLDAFCAALGIADRGIIHLFVVEPGGTIRDHQTGAYGSAAAAAIQAQISVRQA